MFNERIHVPMCMCCKYVHECVNECMYMCVATFTYMHREQA